MACIIHWQKLLSKINLFGATVDANPLRPLPSFPIWGFELDPWHHYPFTAKLPPARCYSDVDLKNYRQRAIARARKQGLGPPNSGTNCATFYGGRVTHWKDAWPSYVGQRTSWPQWKLRFIQQNRDWAWRLIEVFADRGLLDWYRRWLDSLYEMAPSFQKLEWNCQGEHLDLWQHILQFRPSGLRVKRFRHVPALVALTTTQIPIIPRPEGEGVRGSHEYARSRFLLAAEAKRLQGLSWQWHVPSRHASAFKALGNAVHAEVVCCILQKWFLGQLVDEAACDGRQRLLPISDV